MDFLTNNLKREVGLLALIIFLLVGTFGLGNIGMYMNGDGHMSGCPFMGMSAVCQMSPFDHISAWQNMFSAIPAKNLFSTVPFLLFTILVFFIQQYWNTNTSLLKPVLQRQFRYRRYITRNGLQEAFSSGILNSRAF